MFYGILQKIRIYGFFNIFNIFYNTYKLLDKSGHSATSDYQFIGFIYFYLHIEKTKMIKLINCDGHSCTFSEIEVKWDVARKMVKKKEEKVEK